MSKINKKLNLERCADCNIPDVPWASVNRGVLLCDECCSVHRSLGRHISQIKFLKSKWSSSQLAMLQNLVASDANNIWEFSLNDSTLGKITKRKPSQKDPLHPQKADFIRNKYHSLQYAIKNKNNDVQENFNHKLFASVKTQNVEQSLMFIHLGADPNYYHLENGNSPMHVAAENGQIWQIELLFIWGADPGCYNAHGLTPRDLAKKKGYDDIVDRLTECQYELTDRLTFYLCGKRPDHKSGQHFLIPEMMDINNDNTELAKAAKKKLQALSNHLFEELAMDVYDEVDRRELDNVCLQAQNNSSAFSEKYSIPFLPVNSEFSSTRNQGRQKLARFNAREFTNLIIDILCDARRRELALLKSKLQDKTENIFKKSIRSSLSDDEPLYDNVASDEENIDNHNKNEKEKKSNLSSPSNSNVSLSPLSDINDIKRELIEQRGRVHELALANHELKNEVYDLSQKLKSLMQENSALRNGANPDQLRSSIPNCHEIIFGNVTQKSNENLNLIDYTTLPSQDAIVRHTEKITKCIQELLQCAQEAKYEAYGLCSEKIFSSVYDMISLFSFNISDADSNPISLAVYHLKDAASILKHQCCLRPNEENDWNICTQMVIQCAYDVAKNAKALVLLFE